MDRVARARDAIARTQPRHSLADFAHHEGAGVSQIRHLACLLRSRTRFSKQALSRRLGGAPLCAVLRRLARTSAITRSDVKIGRGASKTSTCPSRALTHLLHRDPVVVTVIVPVIERSGADNRVRMQNYVSRQGLDIGDSPQVLQLAAGEGNVLPPRKLGIWGKCLLIFGSSWVGGLPAAAGR
jgi:hypothetical protein